MERVDLPSLFHGMGRDEKFKAYRKLWAKAADYQVLTSFPLHLDLELSGVCNFKCDCCFQNGLLEGPLGLMDFGLFTKVIDEGAAKGLCAIKLQIRGESFLHPRIFEAISYAKEKGILDVQITTNGSLLTRDTIDAVLDSGLDAIIFSVDSHHGDNLTKPTSSRQYASIEQAMDDLLQRRKERGLRQPWIRLQSSIPEMDAASLDKAKTYLNERFPDADLNVVSRIFNFRDDQDAYPDLHTNYTLNPCNYLMHRLAIFWNGQTTVCCSDYNQKFQLGNVCNQSVEEIWHSEKMTGFRKVHEQGGRSSMQICQHCVACISPKAGVVMDRTKCHKADHQ